MKLGLSSVLFIVFLVLKLVGVVTWSWVWVTSPLWMPLAVILFCSVVIVACDLVNKNNSKSK